MIRSDPNEIASSRVRVWLGDITTPDVSAIVNAANESLLGGGGVDGAIHRAAGSELLAECRNLNGCETGKAKITPGFNLKAQYVIHTVGPIWRGGNFGEDELLRSCYQSVLDLTKKYNIRSVAFPCISTGAYCFPPERAAKIAYDTVMTALESCPEIEEVWFVCFDRLNLRIYSDLTCMNLVNKSTLS